MDKLKESYGEYKFKCGTDDDGYPVRMKFKYFWEYARSDSKQDDSPLYVFEGSFHEREGVRELTKDYSVPDLFNEDLLKFVGEGRRPPYRWIVIGPPRSGTSIHVDPLATNAWNALLSGHKRWALFPPDTPVELIKPVGVEKEAASWFAKVYPRTQARDWPTHRPIEVLQRPGETIFVPWGWWHVVMNLDMTVAVTQNYTASSNFPWTWRHAHRSRPKMAAKWLRLLRKHRPDLARVADDIDARGDYGCVDASSCSSSSSSESESDEELAPPASVRNVREVGCEKQSDNSTCERQLSSGSERGSSRQRSDTCRVEHPPGKAAAYKRARSGPTWHTSVTQGPSGVEGLSGPGPSGAREPATGVIGEDTTLSGVWLPAEPRSSKELGDLVTAWGHQQARRACLLKSIIMERLPDSARRDLLDALSHAEDTARSIEEVLAAGGGSERLLERMAAAADRVQDYYAKLSRVLGAIKAPHVGAGGDAAAAAHVAAMMTNASCLLKLLRCVKLEG
ncbi:unnamed protein product [Pedinophyceae sp. YPF-701]|nr:unnamed protein product [Pedinophyceae sp. YPF-701]